MKEEYVRNYRNYCVLDCLIRKHNFPEFLFVDMYDYINVMSYFRELNWITEDDCITFKGRRIHHKLQRKLSLKKIYLHVYPDFSQITFQDEGGRVYLP